jgi:hypothetical protein
MNSVSGATNRPERGTNSALTVSARVVGAIHRSMRQFVHSSLRTYPDFKLKSQPARRTKAANVSKWAVSGRRPRVAGHCLTGKSERSIRPLLLAPSLQRLLRHSDAPRRHEGRIPVVPNFAPDACWRALALRRALFSKRVTSFIRVPLAPLDPLRL